MHEKKGRSHVANMAQRCGVGGSKALEHHAFVFDFL